MAQKTVSVVSMLLENCLFHDLLVVLAQIGIRNLLKSQKWPPDKIIR